MSKKPTSQPLDTREKLLQLAARLFGTQGYKATTLRAIADQVGIEPASIYYHFSSKEELVEAVMAHGAESILQLQQKHLNALPPNASAKQKFHAAILGQLYAIIKYGDYALAHNRLLAQLPEQARERQIERRKQHQKLWSSLIEDLKKEDLLRSNVDLALCRIFILSSINSVQTWFNPKKGSIDSVADQLCTLFFEGAGKKQEYNS